MFSYRSIVNGGDLRVQKLPNLFRKLDAPKLSEPADQISVQGMNRYPN
jgi:hypothetical protein